ncbi:MAG: hypothetical protein HC898_05465 [Phycisphaerales bacterium]|nr:hypothetical protein [Phycisphaerales bacterium]
MMPTCVKGAAIPAEAAAIFWEGFLVLVAHQYLVSVSVPGPASGAGHAHATSGFVQSNGELCTSYAHADERISAFAKLGAVVLKRYQR